MPEDLSEIHHLDGNYINNKRANLALLHRYCHDHVHGVGTTTTGTHDKSQVGEEPDKPKGLRPVLKPSQEGDLLA